MKSDIEQKYSPSIYNVYMVDVNENRVPISRIGGVDISGTIYIGASKNICERIKEFQRTLKELKGKHDGASTFFLMRQNFINKKHNYTNCKLQCEITQLENENEIRKQEAIMLADYFSKYSELPPCNSNFPRKWGEFTKRLTQLWGII